MKKTSDYIFVYGTLRGNSSTGAHREYLENSDFVATAKTRGQLFLVDYYPGMVPDLIPAGFAVDSPRHDTKVQANNSKSKHPENWVIGEIYVLANQKQLHKIDIYEGCSPHSPQPHEYKRDLITATLPNNETIEAWTYIYLGNTHSLTQIQSGDFLKHPLDDTKTN